MQYVQSMVGVSLQLDFLKTTSILVFVDAYGTAYN